MTITLTQANEQGIAPWDDLVWQNDYVTVFRDRYPVTPGHMLFVPRNDTPQMIHRAMAEAQLEGDRLVAAGDCDGYNIGLNMGGAAGQTVMYPHVHLIPRRSGDCADPTGGVRGVIPGKANYRDTSENHDPLVLVRGARHKFNVLFPIGAFGNHVRWLLLLDPVFQFRIKDTEKSYNNKKGQEWPTYQNYRNSDWGDTPDHIKQEIVSVCDDYDCMDLESKMQFIVNKIYPSTRSWHNWLMHEWHYRNIFNSLIPIDHFSYQLQDCSLPTLNLTIDADLAYKCYVKFNSNLNNMTADYFKNAVIDSIASNIKSCQGLPAHKIMQADVLFAPELDRDFYNELIDWAGLTDQYDAANHVHGLWYQSHRRIEQEIVHDLAATYQPSICAEPTSAEQALQT